MSPSQRARHIARNAFATACAAIGLLAIVNVDAPPRDVERTVVAGAGRVKRAAFEAKLTSAAKPVALGGVVGDLRGALAAVELGADNPFAALHDLKPLEAMLAKGVVRFTRQSYRSRNFRDESGYDIVAFDIIHKDQTKSTLLAYLERSLDGSDVVPVVFLATYGPERAKQALFRGGELAESQSVPLSVAQSMVAQRVNAGVPFLSVSR